MNQFIKFPHWVITIFSLLCLVQVMNWLDEIVDSFEASQRVFTWRGHRFSILPNRSFIMDESLKMYGINANQHTFN